MKLHAGQVRYLRETQRRKTRINLLTCANRYGKSSMVACLQLFYLWNKIGINADNTGTWEKTEYRSANIAPHSALTEPVFKAIHQIMTSTYQTIDDKGMMTTNNCNIAWWYLKDRTINTPPYKQVFRTNCYIEHKSLANDEGGSLQGKPYGIITYDEGGRSNHLESELNDAILPRLFDWRAPLHLLSTPSATSHSILYHKKLYDDGLLGLNSTYTQEGSLRENSFFSEKQIQEQYDLFAGNPMRDQVLEGKFVFGGDTLFAIPDVLAISDPKLNQPTPFIPGHYYTIGIDTALGRDEMAYIVLDYTAKPFSVARVEAVKGNTRSPQVHLLRLLDLVDEYGQEGLLQVMLETFNEGSMRYYLDLPPRVQAITTCYGSYQPETVVKIKNDNPKPKSGKNIKKADLLITLQKLISAREVRIPDHEDSFGRATTLKEQLSIYQEDDKGLPTDRVIAFALASYLAEEGSQIVTPEFVSIEW